MKAIELKKTGGIEVLSVSDLQIPKPKPNEIVVKSAAAGINFLDIYQREGRYPVQLPFVLGQEGAGKVTEIGTGVRGIKVGDRVAWTGIQGSYAEYVALPADRAVPVPDKLSDHEAAAAMLQGMTAHYLAYDCYRLKKGDAALVHAAAGGVGLLLVQMAHNLGARVIGTVSTEEKAKLARESGADEVIIYTKTDFESEVKKITSNKGVQVVYDSVGKTTFDKGLNVLVPKGMMVLYGGSSGPVPPLDLLVLTNKGSLYVTRPTLTSYIASHEDLQFRAGEVFKMITSGKLKMRINHIYPLSDVKSAHRDLEERKTTGKLLLIP